MTDPVTRTKQAPGAGAPLPARSTSPIAVNGRRDAFFDNAKYLAIVLVAIGHAWEPLRSDSRTVTALYMAVYVFHMPAFIVIAGYFSRSFDARPDRVRRLVSGVLVPYAVFQVLYAVFNRWLYSDPDVPVRMFTPFWITWFLLALFIWRLTTPIWKTIRYPLPVAVAIGTLAAVSPYIGSTLDLHRVLQFLPFFVLGLVLRPEHFTALRRRAVRVAAVPILCGALPVAYWAVPRLEYAWFYHRESAQELGVSTATGVVMTLVFYGCSAILAAAFLALVPGRATWFTALGAGTLYGYLLHGFFVRGAREWGWYDLGPVEHPIWGPVLVTVTAAVLVTALCSSPVRRFLRPLMEPRLNPLFRDTAPRRE
ncbi:acyltransferase family protein [Streptomyces sp. ST2-7A]|uniref:acyltransferase family protein n=1 Tax=Streptomyces sp. ST2-7A TaxID=2907214 RepID=UPI002278215C